MASIAAWLRAIFGKSDASRKMSYQVYAAPRGNIERQDPEKPPLLPQERMYALTPSSSQEHLPQQAAFFANFPYEIRRKILIFAFGGGTIHMDLQFDRVMPLFALRSPPKEWTWAAAVCHDRPSSGASIEPARDFCRNGRNYVRPAAGELSKYAIGATGWLLSCRQAYAEGIQVLYGTNLISVNVNCGAMMRNLAGLIRPSHLSMITKLRIESTIQGDVGLGGNGMADLLVMANPDGQFLFESIDGHFPQLRRLEVLVVDRYLTTREEDIDVMFVKMDKLVLETSGLRHVEFRLPAPLPEWVYEEAFSASEAGEEQDGLEGRSKDLSDFLWRCLGDETSFDAVYKKANPYPSAPRDCPRHKSGHGRGYWVIPGARQGRSESELDDLE